MKEKKDGIREKLVFSSFHQTAKLVEVHKVTDGFAAFACRAAQKNEPPPPKKPETDKIEGGHIFFEGGKDGTNGKTLDKNSSESVQQHTIEGTKPVKSQLLQLALSWSCGDCGRFHTKICQHPLLAMAVSLN